MKISVLGCGRWGSFIAWYLSTHGHEVCLWGPKEGEAFRVLAETGKNEYVSLEKSIFLTDNLTTALTFSDTSVISIPSQALRGFMQKIKAENGLHRTYVLCMKGIESATGDRLSQVLIETGVDKNNIAVWVGPGHIQAFTQGIPNCMVIDSYCEELKKKLCAEFASPLIRFYLGEDMIGTEVGAAAKNVMGIVAGMLDGCGYAALKGALMARGAREVARLIKAMGGNELSAYGLAHLGDYEATLFSPYSHNRAYGEALMTGRIFEKLAEGVPTASALRKLAEKYGVDLPITEAVYEICYEREEGESGRERGLKLLERLFSRDTKSEFYA